MSEKDPSSNDGKSDDGTSNPLDRSQRRAFLGYLTAGAIGGVITLGVDRLTDETNRASKRTIVTPDEGASRYDVFVQETTTGYEAITSEGNRVDTGSDGWTVLENSIAAVPDGGSIYVSGRYRATSPIKVHKPIKMYGHEAFINHHHSGDFVFRFEGAERHETTLTQPATTGDYKVKLNDTAGIRKGDMVLLVAEDSEPVLGRGQPPGEPHSVLEVEDNSVRLEDSIVWRDDYSSGVLVYVIDPIRVRFSGFDLSSPAKNENYYGVLAHKCRDSVFENLWLDKFGSRGILLEACANFRVRDCTVLQSSDIDAADGYGIQVWSGCHDIIVEGCAAKECRHPLSVTDGGNRQVASRSIIFRDCFVTSNGSSALNCHGGSAHDVRFEGCVVHTWGEPGVRTGAQETHLSGCEFRMDGSNAIHTRNDGQEMIVTVEDTDIFGATNAVKLNREANFEFAPLWKLVHVEGVRAYDCNRFFSLGRGRIDRVRNLLIRGCYWDEVDEEGIRFWNRLDSGLIEGNDFGEAPNGSHILARDGSDTELRKLHIRGNNFNQSEGDDEFIRLSRSEQCIVSNNRFESDTDVNIYIDGTNSTSNLIKENTYYGPNPSHDPVAEDDGSVDRDNYVYDTAADEWI